MVLDILYYFYILPGVILVLILLAIFFHSMRHVIVRLRERRSARLRKRS